MSDMKCPFCQQELKDQWVGQNVAQEYFDCPKCKMNGNPKLWQEFIRTRKALDITVDGLEKMTWGCDSSDAERLLKEITTLEQKEQQNNTTKEVKND